ncbi:MAG: bifunctional 2-polyprenyl-6-hydroxyphenol methylase/3-demethylubiquinol 3-O-methyltransferase UbiG [Bacteriovoracia bacterium]
MNPAANDLDLYNREARNWWIPGSALNVLDSMNPHRFTFFDKFISDWQGQKVLDVGCGGGFTCEFMAKRGARVSGIDLSAASIETAREHARESGLNITYQKGEGENIPFEDSSFDIVTCVDVLEHVPDLTKVLSEIHRVLRPGGTFLFDTINKTFKSKLIMIWLLENISKEIPRGTHDWKMFIPPEVLKACLTHQKFKEIELAGFDIKGIDKKTRKIKAEINNNLSVMYIGKAIKA